MKKVALPLLLSISFMLLAAFAVIYSSDSTYVIGKERLRNGNSMPASVRHFLEFTTPYAETEPYALTQDLITSTLQTSRVLCIMGSPTATVKESQALYDELAHVYTSRTLSVLPTLNRYAIDYVVLDLPSRASRAEKQRYDRWKRILNSSAGISVYRDWGNITVYRIDREVGAESYAIISNSLPNYPDLANMIADVGKTATASASFYKTDKSEPYKRHFPFSDIQEGVFFTEKNIRLEQRNNRLYVTRNLDTSKHTYTVQNEATKSAVLTKITKDTVIASTKEDIAERLDLSGIQVKNCGSKKGILETDITGGRVGVKVSVGAIACFSYRITDTEPGTQYLMHIRSENTGGIPLNIAVSEASSGKTITSGLLNNPSEYILLSPAGAQGHILSFRSESDMNFGSGNILKEISLFRFPLHEIQHIALTHEKDTSDISQFMRTYSEPSLLSGYEYEPDPVAHSTDLLFWQPASLRWTAYIIPSSYPTWKRAVAEALPFAFATPLKQHFTVNGWAHGWTIPPNADGSIHIFSFIRFLSSITLIFAAVLIVISVLIVIA